MSVRHLILGTAGHIDHGKTSLVKALTGIDTDRLPEEKVRGITIDIGFASLDVGDIRLGIVDVPGHERFIRNMLAGATGIDLAMLVVAADDSVMPQTREHLEILQLLGVRQGIIALTKTDLVDETTREVVAMEIRDLVQGSFLESAPIFATSASTGAGITELRSALRSLAVAAGSQKASVAEPFRLPIDRAFVLQGHGTIVTGSVISGILSVGEELEWHHGDGNSELVRVRSLNNHGENVPSLLRGMRGAINLAGVSHDAVRRGQELSTPGYLKASRVLSVQLNALTRAVRHRLPVRLYAGTAEIMATVSILDRDRVEPGQTAVAQLFLDEPITTVWGQPFVLRDSAAETTLGGGGILQPNARKLRRRHLESLERLDQFASTDEATRVAAAFWFAGYSGLEVPELRRLAGITAERCQLITDELLNANLLASLTLKIHPQRVNDLIERILKRMASLHGDLPLLASHDRGHVVSEFQDIGNNELLNALIDRMIREKRLVGDSRRIARADFKPKLSINQRKLKDRIIAEHEAAGFSPPEPSSFINQAAGNAKSLKEIYEVAVAEGLLVKISDGIFLHVEVTAKLEALIRGKLAHHHKATVAEIRDWLGTTRKYAVPICEYLDRSGITRRFGDQRCLA